ERADGREGEGKSGDRRRGSPGALEGPGRTEGAAGSDLRGVEASRGTPAGRRPRPVPRPAEAEVRVDIVKFRGPPRVWYTVYRTGDHAWRKRPCPRSGETRA